MYYIGEPCALKIWDEDDNFESFSCKLYCCSKNPQVEAAKVKYFQLFTFCLRIIFYCY